MKVRDGHEVSVFHRPEAEIDWVVLTHEAEEYEGGPNVGHQMCLLPEEARFIANKLRDMANKADAANRRYRKEKKAK